MSNNNNFSIALINDSKFKKEFLVTASAVEISKAADADIAERAKTFKLAGFSRAGGAPVSLVKRQIGKQVLSEHIDKLIQAAIAKIISDNSLNMSGMPSIDIKEFNPDGDIQISVVVNIMADVPHIDLLDEKFRIETLELNVSPDDVNQAKNALIKMVISYKEAPEGYSAQVGDAVIVDFEGKLNGESFEGNKAEQIRIDIGDGNFIKDFEDKLVGLKKGDDKVLKVKFPNDYNEASLAGQEVDFHVKVHDILVQDGDANVNEELLKRFEVESIEKLEETIKDKILQDFNSIARLRSKKYLFDKIDAEVDFELPQDMVEGDFNNMWKEVSQKIANGSLNKAEDVARTELEAIARRRVKLGLILADLAKKNNILITEEDIENAKNTEKARRPDQASAIDDFFSKQENRNILQGAILEEKVVDFILGKVQVFAISVTTKEFNEKYAKEIQELVNDK
jgi:trigger factor